MELKQRIKSFAELGKSLNSFLKLVNQEELENYQGNFCNEFKELNSAINSSFHYNGWFTRENVLFSINSISASLNETILLKWISSYETVNYPWDKSPKKIGVVMAGNIPMVGFHDMLCVIISGNVFYGKLSSQDKLLLPALSNILLKINPDINKYIEFTSNPFKNLDAVIATGSDNSSRYFDYYFGKYPHIIRKNRNSIAVISGNETQEEMEDLGNDIFQYYGLGCRSVSKIMVPVGYDFDHFFKGVFKYKDLAHNNKYGNNYDYNKTVYLLGKVSLLENGFLIIKEDEGLSSPQACVFYEFYNDTNSLNEVILAQSDKIQCIVSNQETPQKLIDNHLKYIKFGKAQQPDLWDYADGVDTIDFLMKL